MPKYLKELTTGATLGSGKESGLKFSGRKQDLRDDWNGQTTPQCAGLTEQACL